MLTKIKTNSKNEITLLLSVVLFSFLVVYTFLLVYNRSLIVEFNGPDPIIITLFLSFLVALYFIVSKFWSTHEKNEEKKYKIKLENRFKAIASQTGEVLDLEISKEEVELQNLVEKSMLRKEQAISKEDLEWLQKMELTILDSLSDFDFTLEKLSVKMELSPRQIRRRVKQLTGKKYSEYLREIRMKTARQLLESGKVRLIKQVAYEMGMRDVKYFSQQFKAYFGKLPSAYL